MGFISRKNKYELFNKIRELRSNNKNMYITNLALIKKLSKIIEFAKTTCDDYVTDPYCCDCEFCCGEFSCCLEILKLAGEDVSKYE